MSRAPAARVTLTIAGNSSGDRPTASATANRRELDRRTTEKQIHCQDEQNDDDHRAKQKVSKLTNAPPEIRLGLAGSKPCRDCAKRSPETGFDDKHLRRAALDRGAEKDCICPNRNCRLRLYDPRLFLDRKGFACHTRFADQEVHGLDDKAIGRDQIPRRQLDDIAGHDCADRHDPFDAVAHDATCQCQAAFQLLDRRRRAVLLKKAEQGASKHNRQNDGRVHPLLQHQGDRRGEYQNENERAFELP